MDGEISEKTVAEEVSRLVDSAKELQDSAGALISRNSREEDSLRQRALSLDSTIRGLRKSVSSLVESGGLDRKEAEKVRTRSYIHAYCIRLHNLMTSFCLIVILFFSW